MEKQILSYIEFNSDPDNIWVEVDDIYHNIIKDDSQQILFEEILVRLINERKIRYDYETTLKVALEENIVLKVENMKKSALEEMEEELQKYIKEENYEKAAEWRDIINKTK
jgi:excinuclease UvrABC helicase subunit UvrB